MNLARLFLFSVAISLLSNSFAQPANAYDGFSDFLGEVFKGITGQKKKVKPAAIIQPAMRFPARPEKEMEKRKERLEAFALAKRSWIHAACELSSEQSAKYDDLVAKRIKESQEELKKGNNRRRQGFADYAPVAFTFQDGAVESTFEGDEWEEEFVKSLTEKQHKQLTVASQERSQSLQTAQRDRIINILDEELFFTSKQRPLLAKQVGERLSSDNDTLYSLTNQTYYLKYKSPQNILSGSILDVLSPAQRERWERVQKGHRSDARSERYITFMSNEGVDGWYKALDESMKQQAIRLTQAANVRIDYFSEEFKLSDEDVHHLKLAAKGTIIYCMQTWKKSAMMNLKQWEERMNQQQFGNGNFGFSVAVPSTKVIEQHELWKNTLSGMGVDSTASTKKLVNHKRAGKLKYIISLLDRELWLTAKQRDQFEKVLREKLPKKDMPGYEYMYEVVLVAIATTRLDEADVKEILDPEQLIAWKALKGQFAINGKMVRINMQNQGQFNIHIPD